MFNEIFLISDLSAFQECLKHGIFKLENLDKVPKYPESYPGLYINDLNFNYIQYLAFEGKKKLLELIFKFNPEEAKKHLETTVYPGYTPLLLSVKYSHLDFSTAKLLIECGANITVTDMFGNNLLHLLAIQMSSPDESIKKNEFLKFLLEKTCLKDKILDVNHNSQTPLQIASLGTYSRDINTIKLLAACEMLKRAK